MVRSRKVAGLLAEATYKGSQLDHLIFGLGVNANIQMTRLPKALRGVSTSISHELGREINRALLAKRIIQEMQNSYQRFESGHASELLDEAKQICSTLGKIVRVATAERKFVGRALDLGGDGQLLVRLSSGVTVPFYAADVVHPSIATGESDWSSTVRHKLEPSHEAVIQVGARKGQKVQEGCDRCPLLAQSERKSERARFLPGHDKTTDRHSA